MYSSLLDQQSPRGSEETPPACWGGFAEQHPTGPGSTIAPRQLWGSTPPTFGDTHSMVWMETQPEVGMAWGEMAGQHRGDIGDE